jgi:hypothetical protein
MVIMSVQVTRFHKEGDTGFLEERETVKKVLNSWETGSANK